MLHVSPRELTVVLSENERMTSKLSDASLEKAAAILAQFGVVKLAGAWAAEDDLIAPIESLLQNHFKTLSEELVRQGLSLDDSFGFREIVHRSRGRYDMLLRMDGSSVSAS